MGERMVADLVAVANESGRKERIRRQFSPGEEEGGLYAFALQNRENAVGAQGCWPVIEREGDEPIGRINAIDEVSEELKAPQAAEVQSPVCTGKQSDDAD